MTVTSMRPRPASIDVAGPTEHRDLTDLATPFLDLDVPAALARFESLRSALAGAEIHYAVQANPDPVLLQRLCRAGASFVVASPAEVHAVLKAGSAAADLVYSNPVEHRGDVASAYRMGVRLFVVDSADEVRTVAAMAPGSAVLARLATSGDGSPWPSSGTIGCRPPEAVAVLRSAAALGLRAAGVSFHVGSQQRDPGRWVAPIATAAHVFGELRRHGLDPTILDVGGGFPAHHEDGAPDFTAYGRAITAAVRTYFPDGHPRILAEPGRSVVGDAGAVVSTVVAVVWRAGRRWVHLDTGVGTGLAQIPGEAIGHRVETSADGGATGPAILAGPTCDSADLRFPQTPVLLPIALAEADIVRLLGAGAYTTACSTVGFNGLAAVGAVAAG